MLFYAFYAWNKGGIMMLLDHIYACLGVQIYGQFSTRTILCGIYCIVFNKLLLCLVLS